MIMTGTFLGINEGRGLTLDSAKGTSVFSRLAKRRTAIVTVTYLHSSGPARPVLVRSFPGHQRQASCCLLKLRHVPHWY
jgi:hypothetical protein